MEFRLFNDMTPKTASFSWSFYDLSLEIVLFEFESGDCIAWKKILRSETASCKLGGTNAFMFEDLLVTKMDQRKNA